MVLQLVILNGGGAATWESGDNRSVMVRVFTFVQRSAAVSVVCTVSPAASVKRTYALRRRLLWQKFLMLHICGGLSGHKQSLQLVPMLDCADLCIGK